MELPGDLAVGVFKDSLVIAQQVCYGGFVVGEVAEGGGVFEGELERFEGVVEADDAQGAGDVAGGAQHGEDVGGGAEANIPDDEFAGVGGEAFGEAELLDVQGFGFGDGADDGMKGFALGDRMDAVDAIDEFDEFISGRGLLHTLL